MDNFKRFVESSKDDELLLGHTTFLMTNKNNRPIIKELRMKWFINNFMDINNKINYNKDYLEKYYKDNIIDNYSGVFDQPPCISLLEERLEKQRIKEEYEENEDYMLHYNEFFSRHLRYVVKNNDDYSDYNDDRYSENSVSSYYDDDCMSIFSYYDIEDDPEYYSDNDYSDYE